MISSDEVLKTETELQADAAAEAEEARNAPPDPEMMKLQITSETTLEVAKLNREIKMMEMSEKGNITLEEIAAKLKGIREQTASKERIFASEAAIEAQKTDDSGSGGYIS